jgi:hypothetical protein
MANPFTRTMDCVAATLVAECGPAPTSEAARCSAAEERSDRLGAHDFEGWERGAWVRSI